MKGDKVLFIGIGFYDYDELIIRKLESEGANVTYVCQEHPFSFLSRLSTIPFFKRIENKASGSYLLNQLSKIKAYDMVFVIKGDKLSNFHLKVLKENNPNAKFLMYQWDSIERFSGSKSIFTFFDDVYSFDRLNCLEFGFKFLPLFYREKKARMNNYELDVSFVGWLHFDRIELLSELQPSLLKVGFKYSFYLYTSYKKWFLYNYLRKLDFVHFKSLDYTEYLKVIDNSNAILDFHHPKQNGLTMRTIEALGANKKILTTNKDIINYDFYTDHNYLVLNSQTPVEVIVDFLRGPYENLDPEIHSKYSFDRWFSELFDVKGTM